jgi:hypothetical protein
MVCEGFLAKRGGRAAVGLMLALAGAGCSAEGDNAGSGDRGSGSNPGGDFSNATPTGSQGSTTAGGGDFGNSTANPTSGTPQILNPNANSDGTGGEVEFSYIWIANSAEGTVSKVDTRTLEEKGRYLTSPNGLGLPSRTSVGADGNVAVANRGGATNALGGDGGGVTKIYASEQDCPDTNGNGMVDTSTGANDVLPWGEDECIAWHTPLAYYSNRPVAWAPAPAPDAPADVWTAGSSSCLPAACSIEVLRLDGQTGAIKDSVTVDSLMGVDFIAAGLAGGLLGFLGGLPGVIDNYGPYGGAADSGGNFWTFVANTTQLIRIDAVTLEARIWDIQPAGNGYGLTLDEKGRIHLCGALGISRFDPATETWATSTGGPLLGFNGCMTDGAGKIWVGGGVDFGDPGLHAYDAETLAHVQSFPVGAVKGVSIDVDGYIWGVGSGGAFGTGAGSANTAWRVDPNDGTTETYDGLNGAYSYSDMTGFGLSQAGYQEPPPLE